VTRRRRRWPASLVHASCVKRVIQSSELRRGRHPRTTDRTRCFVPVPGESAPSHARGLGIGIIADWSAFPDVNMLALDTEEFFNELRKVAGI
jgi:hypothetical protein